jgi:hypothetical protein
MAPDRLNEIRARLRWSSAKPWRVRYVEDRRTVEVEVAGPGSNRKVAGWPFSRVALVGVPGFATEDAEFIAHAPEDIACLLAEIDRLTASKMGRVSDLEATHPTLLVTLRMLASKGYSAAFYEAPFPDARPGLGIALSWMDGDQLMGISKVLLPEMLDNAMIPADELVAMALVGMLNLDVKVDGRPYQIKEREARG